MRSISATMKKKLASRIQAGDNAMSASLWVGRPTTPLTEDRFLEKQTVLTSENITKTSIAACHPRLMRGATEVYIGYLESGIIKIAKTTYVEEMERHVWVDDIGYSQEADDFCLCFDGTMPKAPNGYVEFKTEQLPWVFWTLNGVLYGRKMFDTSEPVLLAETNCTKVSAIRAMWSSTGGFDFGLVVFFILDGKLYYRQLIAGEWMDAEAVSFGPSDVLWEDLSAFRTWDYRVGVQLKSTTGTFYEMFTQFMGAGKQNAEHIEITRAKATGNMQKIEYKNTKSAEHAEISSVSVVGALLPSAPPQIVSVHNEDDGNGDWGKVIIVSFDLNLLEDSIASNLDSFTLTDENGLTFTTEKIELRKDTKNEIILTFIDFNMAVGECQLDYVPGTIKSFVGILAEEMHFAFTPEKLNPPKIDPPVPVKLWNTDDATITVEFTEGLTNDVSNNQSKFTVTMQEYNMVPGGELIESTRQVINTKIGAEVNEQIDLGSGSEQGVVNSGNTLMLGVSQNE